MWSTLEEYINYCDADLLNMVKCRWGDLYAENAYTYKVLVYAWCFVDVKDNDWRNRKSGEIRLIEMDVRDEQRTWQQHKKQVILCAWNVSPWLDIYVSQWDVCSKWAQAWSKRQHQLFYRLLREQWIRAKYERKEFMCVEKQEPYSAGKN